MLATFTTAPARAGAPLGGLTVAISPDGKVYFSTSGGRIFFSGDKAIVIGDSDVHAKVTPDFKVETFGLLQNSGYATGASPDQKFFMFGRISTLGSRRWKPCRRRRAN